MFTKNAGLKVLSVILIIFMLALSVGCGEIDAGEMADVVSSIMSSVNGTEETPQESEDAESKTSSSSNEYGGATVKPSSPSAGGGTSSKPKDNSGTVKSDAPAAKKTVTFATWINHKSGEGAAPIASFEQKYNATVNLLYLNQNTYVSELAAYNASGQAPDVFVDNNEFPYLLPVAKDLKTVNALDLSEAFWDSFVINSSTVGGKTYLVNSDNSPWSYRFMCFYNKSLFKEYGLKTPGEYYAENNWTIDTFKDCARSLSRLGYLGASVRPEFAAGVWETAAVEFKNGKFVNTITGSDLSSAYKWMLEGRDEGIFSVESEITSFKNGYCGMFLYGDFGLRTTGGLNSMDVNSLGFVPLPKVNKTDTNYPSAGTWRAYGICKNSKNAELAGSFLRWFLDFDNYKRSSMFLTKEANEFFDDLRQTSECTYMFKAASIGNSQIKSVSPSSVEATLRSLKNQVEAQIINDNAYIK